MPYTKKVPFDEYDPEQDAKNAAPKMDEALRGLSFDAIEMLLEQVIAHMYVTNPTLIPQIELLGHFDDWVATLRKVIIREWDNDTKKNKKRIKH